MSPVESGSSPTASVPRTGSDAAPSTWSDALLFRSAFEAADDALLLVEAATGVIVAANPAFEVFGEPAGSTVGGRSLDSVAPFTELPDLRAACLTLLPGGSTGRKEFVVVAGDGMRRSLELTATGFSLGVKTFVRVSLRDVTAGCIRERRSHQARKMESVRLFAGAVAHDFNNVLSCIRGYVSIALETAGGAGEVREILTRVKDVSVRAGELPQRLLDFSRQPKLTLHPLDLAGFLRTAAPELRTTLPPGIAFRLLVPDEPLEIGGDEPSLRLALTLLLRNARESMGEHGEVTLALARWSMPGAHPKLAAPGQETFARLSVRDSGPGIPPEAQERLFEPGFTTKKSGRQSGMGLAAVYRVTVQHGGWVEVHSEVGQGATFNLLFPLAGPPATAPA